MNITQHPGADWLELRLTGRLDATWADHVSDTIEAAVRAGSHRIALNFAAVDYISSLGIRVLLTHHKRLAAVNGLLVITEPSRGTLTILKAAGLAALLVNDAPASAAQKETTTAPITRSTAQYQLYPQAASTPLACAVVGNPTKFGVSTFDADDCRPLRFPRGSFGLGLGGFGEGFADCRSRFGEFMAAGGCAISLPTNEPQAHPDYVVEEGGLVPRVEVLYALSGSGEFPVMARFDATADGPGHVALTALTEALLEFSRGNMIAFAVLAEAAGIVGATLRRSPAAGVVPLDLPDVRDCLSFTTSRTADRSLALLVGVAARVVPDGAAPFLRPMTAQGTIQGHVHAAVFPYRPVQRGELALDAAITDLLAASSPTTVMHLMADTRPFEGVGQTELVRGACWFGSLPAIVDMRQPA